ncbi:MAG: chemotaxis protein [Pseudomonadota bacterium]
MSAAPQKKCGSSPFDEFLAAPEAVTIRERLEAAAALSGVAAPPSGAEEVGWKAALERLRAGLESASHDIAALESVALVETRLPEAREELAAIVEDTETAATAIMAAAEALLEAGSLPENERAETVEGHALSILEACAFQDITGQRAQKISKRLDQIAKRAERFAQIAGVCDAATLDENEQREADRSKDLHLNGPQTSGEAKSQDAVDEIFSQDDIDALFD